VRAATLSRGFDVLNAHTGAAQTLAVAASRGLGAAPGIVRTRGDARAVRRRPLAGLLWRRTAAFIAASRAILDDFHAAFPQLSLPARAVWPGLPDPAAGSPRPEPPGPPVVGIVGRLDPVKGHGDFLRAAAQAAGQARGARFLVAGREENVTASELKDLVHWLGLEGSVDIVGHAPDAFEVMSRCHVGVVASVGSEAISRAALEWMAAGKPLVATAVGCLPELIEEGVTGHLVPPGDPHALGERLSALLRDPAARRRLGAAGRERFLTRFSLERQAADTEAVYAEALAARHGAESPASNLAKTSPLPKAAPS
jgi:glycosyltransferase involved in cell wall biosynthesis